MHRLTAGVTGMDFCADPLGTEEELTPGDASYNPFDDPEVTEDDKRRMEFPANLDDTMPKLPEFETDEPLF